jgi:hypothetical protein
VRLPGVVVLGERGHAGWKRARREIGDGDLLEHVAQ